MINAPRVYIVEDEAIIVMELEERLLDMGCVVCGFATRAETALREIPVLEPDVVLLDNRLRGAMNGVELASRIASIAGPPIVFLSADPKLRDGLHGTAEVYFVPKPFHPATLRAAIHAALDG